MQHSKVETTPTRHHREHDVLGAAQASFPSNFKGTSKKLGEKRISPQRSKDIMRFAIYYKIQITN